MIAAAQRTIEAQAVKIAELERETRYFQSTDFAVDRAMNEAAAVQAEREACAKEAHHVISAYYNIADTQRAYLAKQVAAAIRARNGAGRE